MITITQQAAQRLQQLLRERNCSPGEALRLSVEKGGCAGFKYSMTLSSSQPNDQIIEREGTTVFVDHASLEKLDGATIDYDKTVAGYGFRITNPQAAHSCDCGSSFQPKKNR